MPNTIPLTKLPKHLNADFGGEVSYRQAYLAVLDGKIPAKQRGNGRYQVDEADLPAIAAVFGLTTPAAA